MQHVTQSGVDCSRLRHVMSCDVFGGGGPRGAGSSWASCQGGQAGNRPVCGVNET